VQAADLEFYGLLIPVNTPTGSLLSEYFPNYLNPHTTNFNDLSMAAKRRHYGWTRGKHKGWGHRHPAGMIMPPRSNPRGKWIQKALGKRTSKGYLHRALGIPKGTKIPLKKLQQAKKKGGRIGRAARLAMQLRKFTSKRKRK
jgi:hypothetical protein